MSGAERPSDLSRKERQVLLAIRNHGHLYTRLREKSDGDYEDVPYHAGGGSGYHGTNPKIDTIL